jgi:hypothetical protein
MHEYLKAIQKKGVVRVMSPFVSGSNPALGTTMYFFHKPATLFPLPKELARARAF